jgi:hypothetical protein
VGGNGSGGQRPRWVSAMGGLVVLKLVLPVPVVSVGK